MNINNIIDLAKLSHEDIIVFTFILAVIVTVIYITVYYFVRVKKSYGGLISSMNQISNELELLHDSTQTSNLISDCDNIFEKSEILNRPWEIFKKRFCNNGTYSLLPPKDFFSRENLVKLSTKNLDRIKALPGLLTAGGLLGSFMAILLGLIGINPDNIDTIYNLVNGLSWKFASSIVALFCSIVFVFLERGLYSKVGEGCYRLQRILEELFPTLSSNEILYHMEKNMGQQIETMNNLSAKLVQNSLESLEEMADSFRKALTDGAVEQFQFINDTVHELSEMIKKTQETQDIFLNRMDSINKNSETFEQQHRQTITALQEMIERIDKKVERFKDIIDYSSESFDKFSHVASEIAKIKDEFINIMPYIKENNASITALTENLDKSVKYFNNITNEISSSKLNEMVNYFKEGIKSSLTGIQDALKEDLDRIKDGYKWHDEQLNKFLDVATINIDKIHSSMQDYTDQTSKFLKQYDEAIVKAVGHFETNVQTMDDSLQKTLTDIRNNFNTLNETLTNINSNIRNGVE